MLHRAMVLILCVARAAGTAVSTAQSSARKHWHKQVSSMDVQQLDFSNICHGCVLQGSQLFLQFITRYLHYSGQLRCRVTTLTRFWTDGSNSADLINGFDQETAAALMARLATYKMETEDDFDPTRFLDRSLIRMCQRCDAVRFLSVPYLH